MYNNANKRGGLILTISIAKYQVVARMGKCLKSITISLRPDIQDFRESAINYYIDAVVRQKFI